MRRESEVLVPIGGDAERVWAALTDTALLSGLERDVGVVADPPVLRAGTRFVVETAARHLAYRVVEAEEPSRLVLEARTARVQVRDVVTFEPVGRRCLVRWRLVVRGDRVDGDDLAVATTLQRLTSLLAQPTAAPPAPSATRFRRPPA